MKGPPVVRFRTIVFCAALAALVVPATAIGSPGWTRLSPDDLSGIDQATVTTQGGRVTAAWPAGSGTALAGAIEFRGFSPTPGAPLGGAGAVTVAASGYTSLSQRPALVSVSGGLRVLYGGVLPDGSSATFLSGPLQEGIGATAAPTRASGGFVGPLDAVSLPGGFVFANGENGDLHTVRDAATPDGADLQRQLGGCCSYHPAVGVEPIRTGVGGVVLQHLRSRGHRAPAGRSGHRCAPRRPRDGPPEPVADEQRLPPEPRLRNRLPGGLRVAGLADRPVPDQLVGARRGGPDDHLHLVRHHPGNAADGRGGGRRTHSGPPGTRDPPAGTSPNWATRAAREGPRSRSAGRPARPPSATSSPPWWAATSCSWAA